VGVLFVRFLLGAWRMSHADFAGDWSPARGATCMKCGARECDGGAECDGP